MDYSIPWALLPENDKDFFERINADLGPSGVTFNGTVTRQDLASACSRICEFRLFIPDPDENHINFAIGGAFSEFNKRFGEEDGELFMKNFERISKFRDYTLKASGASLIYLQMVEHQIKGCCAMIGLKGLKLTFEDFQSGDPNRTRQTLGWLKRALIGTGSFSSKFEDDFTKFVADRNRLVHSLWNDEMKIDERTGLPTEDSFTTKIAFISSLVRQASEMEKVFRGLIASIHKSLSDSMKIDKSVSPWIKYIPNYESSLKTNE